MRLVAAVTVFLVACSHQEVSETKPSVTATPSSSASVELSLVVYSGRENPPAQTTKVHVGTEVIVRVAGLGPAHARIFDPSGAAIASDGGLEQRIIVSAKGKWRIEHAEAPGSILAYLDAQSD